MEFCLFLSVIVLYLQECSGARRKVQFVLLCRLLSAVVGSGFGQGQASDTARDKKRAKKGAPQVCLLSGYVFNRLVRKGGREERHALGC